MNRPLTRTTLTRLTALLATAALVVAACGGDDDDTSAEAVSDVGNGTTSPDTADTDSAGTNTTRNDDNDDDDTDVTASDDDHDDDDDDDGQRADVVIEAAVAGGEVTAAETRFPVAVGSSVLIVVEADVEEEVHVHGYDLHGDVEPDEPAEVEFVAEVPGVFEVELEGSHLLLFEIEVS